MSVLLLQGDARRIPLASGSVHCCVTSPPYWGLRDYGVSGQIGLEESPTEYVETMVAPMPLEEVGKQIDRINAEIEKEYPELRYYLMNEVGDVSGRALRVARQATESKVQERRTGYDESLALAQRMALAIGSIRGYEGYAGLGAEDPDDPAIDHQIGHRPVFAPDPLDDIEEGTAFWQMVTAAVGAGMPLEVVLRREGWEEDDIQAVTQANEAAANAAVERVKQRMEAAGGDDMGDEL